MDAEQDMLAATGGINTHKGAIFSLGILCAAAGRQVSLGGALTADALCGLSADMTRGLCAREMCIRDSRWSKTAPYANSTTLSSTRCFLFSAAGRQKT